MSPCRRVSLSTSVGERQEAAVKDCRRPDSHQTTTVHFTPVPPKEGPDATSQVPQRIPTARPGRVVYPVIPFEKASVADPHNARMVARNPVVSPAAAIPSVYCYHLKSDCSNRQHQQELQKDHMQYRRAQHLMDAKVVPEMSPDMQSSPYCIPRSAPKADLSDRAVLQWNMLHGIAPFNGIAAVAGGYSKVGAAQYGITRMY